RRPEVLALEAAVAAAEAAVDFAKRSNKPLLSAMADLQNIAAGSHFPRRNNTASLMLQFTMTLSDGGITKAKVEEAEAQLAQLRERLEAERQRVAMEVRQAQLQLESAEARVAATVTQVESAEESLRVLEVGYREGVNTLTDVLAAQAALEAARYARVAALYDVQIARVRLLKALGKIAEPFRDSEISGGSNGIFGNNNGFGNQLSRGPR
ncbi:MAG: TolC family protein, partial [Armatimonadota bacterium]